MLRLASCLQVHTLDVQTQKEGPRWTLHQWCLYWEARRSTGGGASAAPAQQMLLPPAAMAAPAEDEADSSAVMRKRSVEEEAAAQQLKGISADSKRRLLEVAALPLAGTPLEVCVWAFEWARPAACFLYDVAAVGGHRKLLTHAVFAACLPAVTFCVYVQAEVSPPTAVRAVDLAQQVWPEGAPGRPVAGVSLVMSPEGCYTDFHLAVGGSSGGCLWEHWPGDGCAERGWRSGSGCVGPVMSVQSAPVPLVTCCHCCPTCHRLLALPCSGLLCSACRPARSVDALPVGAAQPGASASHPPQPGNLCSLGLLRSLCWRLPAGAL